MGTPVSDIEFIDGSYSGKFSTHVDKVAKTVTHKFIVEKDGETRKYDPIRYIDLILEWYYIQCDKQKEYKDKLNCLINAESKIFRLIERNGLGKIYDFTNIYKDLEIQKNKIKTYYEIPIMQKTEHHYHAPVTKSIIADTIKDSPINMSDNPMPEPSIKKTIVKIFIGVSVIVLGAIILFLINKYCGVKLVSP